MIHFFTTEQGNLLIRFLLAHIAADFILQTGSMVKTKSWISASMFLHIVIVFALTWLFTGLWLPAIIVAALHWLVDSLKVSLQKKYPQQEAKLFAADQLIHLLTILVVWCWHYNLFATTYKAILFPFNSYKISLLVMGYAFVIWPMAYILKFALQKMAPPENEGGNVNQGGKLIGQFERIIILSFVLLGQYEAIGFLITGKGIIRFAEKEKLASEYVLVGTMMSYAISILTGLSINWLLSLNS
jgi:uncharacterized membrane protein